jgi:hypothetical protein
MNLSFCEKNAAAVSVHAQDAVCLTIVAMELAIA